jgi:hypothetical protein
MPDKFSDIPIESDTKIIFKKVILINGYDVLYETWSWKEFWGESLIFTDVDVGGLTDKEIRKLTRTSGLVENRSKIIVNRSYKGFILCNFNFR